MIALLFTDSGRPPFRAAGIAGAVLLPATGVAVGVAQVR